MDIINYDDLRLFAYSNDRLCRGKIRGITITFPGLGGMAMFGDDYEPGLFFAERGIVYLNPYVDPWCWMNSRAVDYTDRVVDCIFKKYSLPEGTPVVSTGGSMGGQSALVYMVYAARTPAACVVNCPVCDLPYHYTERNDLPRTLYSAFYGQEGTLEEAMKTASPLHLADRMPQSDYYIFACEKDEAVNKERHADAFVKALRPDLNVTYHNVPGRGHCDLPDDMKALYDQYIVRSVDKYAKL